MNVNEHADSWYALVRLHCQQHHRDHWLVIQHVPWPPPSADVLRHALRRFDCQGRPFAVDIVATFPSPLGVPWSDLIPAAAPDAPDAGAGVAGNEAGTDTPGQGPGPGRGRGGHLLDEARKLGLTPLRPAPSVSAISAPAVPPTAAGRAVVVTRADGARLECFRFQPFQTRRGIDTVLGLRFGYDAALIAALKDILRQWRPVVRQANPRAQVAGGWLPAYRCWFIEPPAWPAVAVLLRRYGYPAPDSV
jgi:hypothetical protein